MTNVGSEMSLLSMGRFMCPGMAPFAGPKAGECEAEASRGRGPNPVGVPTGEAAGPIE